MATSIWPPFLFCFLIIKSTRLRNDLHAFKKNFPDILFHSSSITVLIEPILGWEVAFVLFSKTPPHIGQSRGLRTGLYSCLICYPHSFLVDFQFITELSYFLTAVKKPLFVFCSVPHTPPSNGLNKTTTVFRQGWLRN